MFLVRLMVLVLCASCDTVAVAPGSCDQVQDTAGRLACYDRLYPPHTAQPRQESTAQVAQEEAAAQAGLTDDTAGGISGTIESITVRPHNERVYYLDNGQVWVQVRARFRSIKKGDGVTINPARMGGYILTTEHGVSTRVKRVQ